MEGKSHTVVILGAGFGGIRCALDLAHYAPKGTRIVLIDRNDFHNVHPPLYEVATAHMGNPSHICTAAEYHELKGAVTIPLKEIFAHTPVAIETGTVKEVAPERNIVTLEDGRRIRFDYLVYALGSEPNYMGLAHLREFALPLKRVEDALNIRNAITELFYRKKPREELNIVIAGGGPTGCEFTGELAEYLPTLCGLCKRESGTVAITLVEARGMLLGEMRTWIQQAALKRLRTLGIRILLETVIVDVDREYVHLRGGAKLPYDLLIWTAGIKGTQVDREFVPRRRESKIPVNWYLQMVPYKHIFAVGDSAFFLDEDRELPVPATATAAIDQGRIAAGNILRLINKKLLLPYYPRPYPFAIPLGGRYGVVDLRYLQIEGWLAWLLKQLSILHYFTTILPWRSALARWWAGTRIFLRND